jgi:4-hydroxyproline epimerase
MAERMTRFRDQFDDFRRVTVNEPRGHEAIVGALLCEPSDPTCDAGVIFYNNVGYLGMCGHGTIGLVATLAHMGRVQAGSTCRLETPMGNVEARLNPNGSVTIRNVASYRLAAQVPVEVPGFGTVRATMSARPRRSSGSPPVYRISVMPRCCTPIRASRTTSSSVSNDGFGSHSRPSGGMQ